jgi:hypothetical protein
MTPSQIERPEYTYRSKEESVQDEVVLTETDARAAVPLGRMRYVLGISLSLSIVALIVVYAMFF